MARTQYIFIDYENVNESDFIEKNTFFLVAVTPMKTATLRLNSAA
jgi:hypothetical protein